MKIVNIIGGLGNQMFQYAFAIALKATNPEDDIYIDTSHFHSVFFNKYKGRNLHNGFEINKILDSAILPTAKWWQISKVSYYIPNYLLSRFFRKYIPKRRSEYIEKQDFTYDPFALQRKGDIYYEGYWQAYPYFADVKEDIRTAFKFRDIDGYNLNLICKLHSCNSVSIHIRRGDYVSNKGFGGICDLDYYTKAINLVINKIQKPVFYVFSNDIKWCEENIKPLLGHAACCFVNHNTGSNSYKDMELMSHCKVNIIANSSFSWWAAYLNNNEDPWVIAPRKWNNYFEETDVYSKEWTLV